MASQDLEELNNFDPGILTTRYESDKKKDENSRDALENKLKLKEEAITKLGKKFVPTKSTSSGSLIDGLSGKKEKSPPHPHKPFPDDFPEEDLPTVGELFTHQKQRYLGITYWEEEKIGRTEAQRLKASLCFNPNP